MAVAPIFALAELRCGRQLWIVRHTSRHHSFMKTLFTALAASLVFGLTAIAEPTNSQSQVAPQLSTRIFKITPDAFFSSLKHRIAPKDGESNQQLILCFFKQQHIDLEKDKAAIFLNEKKGLLLVRATEEDLDKIERLVAEIADKH
jgi:hypothetical protein